MRSLAEGFEWAYGTEKVARYTHKDGESYLFSFPIEKEEDEYEKEWREHRGEPFVEPVIPGTGMLPFRAVGEKIFENGYSEPVVWALDGNGQCWKGDFYSSPMELTTADRIVDWEENESRKNELRKQLGIPVVPTISEIHAQRVYALEQALERAKNEAREIRDKTIDACVSIVEAIIFQKDNARLDGFGSPNAERDIQFAREIRLKILSVKK